MAVCGDGNEPILGTYFDIAAGKTFKGTRIETIADGTIWSITAFCSASKTDVSST